MNLCLIPPFSDGRNEAWAIRKLLLHGHKSLLLKQTFIMSETECSKPGIGSYACPSSETVGICWFGKNSVKYWYYSFVLSSVATHWLTSSKKHQRVKTSISEKLSIENIPTNWGLLQMKKRLLSYYLSNNGTLDKLAEFSRYAGAQW